MVTYRFFLTIRGSNDTYEYSQDLNEQSENRPAAFFSEPDVRHQIQDYFQQEALCEISEANLDRIIRVWVQDIQEGYRTSSLSLDLPLLSAAKLLEVHESGYHELPEPIPPTLENIEPCGGVLPPLDF